MGISKKTIIECTCDVCIQPCQENEGVIGIIVKSGWRDVGPAVINGKLAFYQPYGVQGGIVCDKCKLKYLKYYVESLQARVDQTN